jgi:hypothetical protein
MIGFKSSLSVKGEKRCTTSVTLPKWRFEVSNLKVGDIVRYDWALSAYFRGIITKIETRDRLRVLSDDHPPALVRTYAVVFWFRSRECLAVNADRLTKVEVEGV